MKRRIFVLSGVVVAVGIALAGATVAIFPKLVTGDYCRLTVTAIQVGPRGEATLIFSGSSSAGTWIGSRALVDGAGTPQVIGMSGGIPAWPGDVGATLGLNLVGPDDRVRGRPDPDRATLAERLTVEEGHTYDVRPGRPLTLYRFTDGDGHVREGRIEVWPQEPPASGPSPGRSGSPAGSRPVPGPE